MAFNEVPISRIKQPGSEDIKVYDYSLRQTIGSMYATGGTLISGANCAISYEDPLVPQDKRPTLKTVVIQRRVDDYLYLRGKQDFDHTNAYALQIQLSGTVALVQSMAFIGGTIEIPGLWCIEHRNPTLFKYLDICKMQVLPKHDFEAFV